MQHFLAFIHTPNVVEYLERFSYVGVFIWFTIFDFFAPFPDEVSLLTVGYLAAQGYFNPFLVILVPFASFILTDTFSFYLVRGGRSLFGWRARRKPKHNSLYRYVSSHLEKSMPVTIVTICFIPRMRLWGPIVAGAAKTSYKKFIFYDAIGVGLFVALYANLGYFFGVSLSSVFHQLFAQKTSVFVAILFVLGIVLLFVSNKVEERAHRHYGLI